LVLSELTALNQAVESERLMLARLTREVEQVAHYPLAALGLIDDVNHLQPLRVGEAGNPPEDLCGGECC
jgi:hypothetical protein